jgi:uncharacterized glyoxalase superfamily protein PhnB
VIKNRSVPADIILPHLMYPDVAAAADWLAVHFGFKEHYRYGEPVSGAQMYLGKAYIMLKATQPGSASPSEAGCVTQTLTVFVDDVDEHYENTKAAGARIVEELHETGYGERQYGVMDFAGHHWLFSQHAQDVSPTDWGAVLAQP